jgi:cobalt-zinc-cadmium efflux system protein
MGHDHAHGSASLRSGEAARRPLTIALGLGVLTFVVQVVVAVATGSLALLTDSAHVLTDAVGIGLALAAVAVAGRPTRPERTFGLYRLEVLAALVNALLLLGVAVWALVEGIGRLGDPPDVPGLPVLIVGGFGLVTNLIALRILSGGGSMVAEGARLDVLADTIGSVGVMLGGVVILTTGAEVADTWVGLAIAVWIIPRSIRLAADALRVLVQAAPPGVDLGAVTSDLEAVPQVVGVHDLHVWTLTSDMEVLTAHVMVAKDADHHAVLDRAREVLAEHHGIHHATLQVEPEDHTGCDEMDW